MKFTVEFERALAVHRQGKLREAFHRYAAILLAEPRHAPALHYSGVVLHQSGQHAAAAERIRAALDVEPGYADAWSNLALVLDAVGRHAAAINALKEALRHAPEAADIASNLAAALLAQGQVVEAEAIARRATQADPRHPPGWFNLALALQRQSRVLEALDAAARALALDPQQAAYAGLKAQLEQGLQAPERSRATLEAAIARTPMAADLRFELGSVLEDAGAPQDALQSYEQAARLDPRHGPALAQGLHLRRWLCDWHGLAAAEQRCRDAVAQGVTGLSPFVLLAQPGTRAEQQRAADTWARDLARGTVAVQSGVYGSRLRIGYLSADFHTHATAYLTAGLFEQHDRGRFEVVAYSLGPDDESPMRERLVNAFDRFVDVRGAQPDRVAAKIRADGIDLLVDLKGHTAGAPPSILALRPAPVQAHYLGYPGSLGAGLVDYLIGDAIVTPPEHAADYAEALVRLPGSYQVNDRLRPITPAPHRTALGLPDDAVVFCNFNAAWKLRPETFDAWAQVLKQVPGSVLWLLARRDDDPAVANLRREFAARGLAPTRLVFATSRPNPEYLGLYARADVVLDTWPYNAHTTGSDALWGGCPVVTFAGETFASRVGASLAHGVGLPELVAKDAQDAVRLAVALGHDPARRARLRAHLAGPGRASPLFDTVATTRALEAAYIAMVEQRRRGVRGPIDVSREALAA